MGTLRPKHVVAIQLRDANIGEDYWECDFKNFEGPERAAELSMKYLQNLKEMKEKGIGILYAGPNGPGKTTLAMIVFKYLVRSHWDCYTISLGELVEEIQKSWKGDGESEAKIRSREADFLLIDDIGKEHRGGSGFVQTVFDNLIRQRVQKRRPTFITTNLTKSELKGTYGDSVMSLLDGKLIPITVNGSDHRADKLKKEIRKALK